MDYGFIMAFILVFAGIAGFIVLARSILSNWKAGSRGKEESDVYRSKMSKDFENCYNECMRRERWERDKTEACDWLCRSRLDTEAVHP
ncbi:MAG TPA: hypothetical protein VK463_17280 [Desulfomonilaceae bacterium]|nr:hypothetical protein [Desulfomonilaceae bacterium]